MNSIQYCIRFMIGIVMYEAGSRIIYMLENKGDYGSPLYLIVLAFVTLGMTIAVVSAIKMYFWGEEQLKKLKEQECEV